MAAYTQPEETAGSPWYNPLLEYFESADITDPRIQANILAQVQSESGGKPKSESFKYSPERALEIFPKYFENLEDAKTVLAQGPEAFGNRVYGGRMGNEANEGHKYHGRGLIQLTGKDNYKKYGELLGIDLVNNPELANDPVTAQKIASSYYLNKGRGRDLSDINVVNKLTGFVDNDGESQKRAQLANEIFKNISQRDLFSDGSSETFRMGLYNSDEPDSTNVANSFSKWREEEGM